MTTKQHCFNQIAALKARSKLLDEQIVHLERLRETIDAWQAVGLPSVGQVNKAIDIARQQQQLILQEVIEIRKEERENNVD